MSGFLQRLADFLNGGPPPAPTGDATARPAPPPAAITADDDIVPDTSRERVARLLAMVADIEARAERDALLVSALTEVRQMRDTHLPQLLTSYAGIPPAHRAEIFRTTGRSASYKLNEGIDKMIARLEALSRSMAQEDIDSFADNLKFIDRRYGPGDPLP